ncbi:unnamed protein product [Calypogeia fissa]
MAIQRILEYAAILECMEGDDAFELEKAQILVRSMETALAKAALDTDLAKQCSASSRSAALAGNGVAVSPPVCTLHRPPSVDPTLISGCSNAASIAMSGPNLASSSSDQSPSSVTVSPPNNTQIPLDTESRSTSPAPLSVTPPNPVNSAASSSASSSSTDLRNTIQENPLLDLVWVTEDELIEMNEAMSMVDCSLLPNGESDPDTPTSEEPYVPVLPPRHLEWESSKVDACLWKIKNINNLAPLSIEIWQAWGTGRLVMLIKFLSGDARRMVLDHITFLYIRDFTIEATQELIDHPHSHFLTRYGASRGIRMVEALVKPGMFSDDLSDILGGSNKKCWNLNDCPQAPPKRRGMYANHTPVPGVGRGTTPAPLIRSPPEGMASCLRPGISRTLPGNESPLQCRNIRF